MFHPQLGSRILAEDLDYTRMFSVSNKTKPDESSTVRLAPRRLQITKCWIS